MGAKNIDNKVKNKYGNRKRGDSWEGRIFLLQESVSLYDIDTRRLEMRKKALREKCDNFVSMNQEFTRIVNSIQFITVEYYERLRNECEKLYSEIIEIVNAKRKTRFTDAVDLIYKNSQDILAKLKYKNPELAQKANDKKVKDWFYEWLWNYKHGHKAKTTFKGYVGKTKNHIIRVFGEKYLSEVTTLEIQMFINDLMQKYKPSTVRQIYLLLQEGFARAVKDKIIAQTPVVDIEIPTVIPNTMMCVNIETEKTLIDIFSREELCYPFAILIDTGLRSSELCGLKWKNIDFKNRKLYIRQSYQRVNEYEYKDGEIVKTGSILEETTLKSRTSKREIPMSKGVHKILLEIYNDTLRKCGQVDDNNFVFINTKGRPVTGECLRDRLDDLLERNNLQSVSLHRFRHTFATRLYEAKVKLKNIQALLGHSTVQMTERYLHIDEEDQANAIEQLEQYNEEKGIRVCV